MMVAARSSVALVPLGQRLCTDCETPVMYSWVPHKNINGNEEIGGGGGRFVDKTRT